MTLRYARWLSIALIVLGVLTLGLALVTEGWLQVALGVVLTLLGVLVLKGTPMARTPHGVIV